MLEIFHHGALLHKHTIKVINNKKICYNFDHVIMKEWVFYGRASPSYLDPLVSTASIILKKVNNPSAQGK